MDLFTINENCKMEQEDDPDLKIDKPAFNTGTVRFKPSKPKKSKNSFFDIFNPILEDFVPMELKARS